MVNGVIHIEYFKTDLGELVLGSYNDRLCLCDWRYRRMRSSVDKRIQDYLQATFEFQGSAIIEQAKSELNEYFQGNRKEFSVPILLAGTDFQIKVWEALLQIPYGKTLTYLDLSKLLDNQKAIRAVASANGANAISIIVPCHRIIGSDGELVGYAGGIPAKKKLLQLERGFVDAQLTLFE